MPNAQCPMNDQAPLPKTRLKQPKRAAGASLGHWALGILWSLVIGHWSLGITGHHWPLILPQWGRGEGEPPCELNSHGETTSLCLDNSSVRPQTPSHETRLDVSDHGPAGGLYP